MSTIRTNGPFLAAAFVLLAVVVVMSRAGMRLNDGRFIYALDDTYIHMAISKNIVEHGVWGCTKYHFSSSSSSVLWTTLLAANFLIFGVREWAPLALNLICSLGFLYVGSRVLARWKVHQALSGLTLIACVFATPMFALIFGGMEHSLHALLTLAFGYVAAKTLENRADKLFGFMKDTALLVLLAPLLSGARYEGLFLIGIVCVALVIRRHLLAAAAVGVAAVLPIAILGYFAVGQGWEFLPNSLILKATNTGESMLSSLINFFGYQDYKKLLRNHHIFILTVVASAIFTWRCFRDRTIWRASTLMVALFVLAMLVHVMYAGLGWLYRYEAYLVAWGLVACAGAAFEGTRGSQFRVSADLAAGYIGAAVLAILLAIPFGVRSIKGITDTVASTHDRYLWHVVSAEFVKKHYPDGPIVINDLGAIAFYTDARLLDMFGLGNKEPLDFRRGQGGYAADDLERWARDGSARIAVLQIEWIEVYPRVPKSWARVATLHLPPNVAFGDSKEAFFAVDPAEAGRLRAALVDHYGPFEKKHKLRLELD